MLDNNLEIQAINRIKSDLKKYDVFENNIEIFVLTEIGNYIQHHNIIGIGNLEPVSQYTLKKICNQGTTWIIDRIEELLLNNQGKMVKLDSTLIKIINKE